MSKKETLFCPHLYGSVCTKCIVKKKQCENCGWIGYNYEVCHECGHKSTMDECRTWAKFLRAFNARDACIDVTNLSPSQISRMDGLLALDGRKFEVVSVNTKVGQYKVLFLSVN